MKEKTKEEIIKGVLEHNEKYGFPTKKKESKDDKKK